MRPSDIATVLRNRNKQKRVQLNVGSLNSVIGSLRKRGLIVPEDVDHEGHISGRAAFRVTDDGAAESRAWLIDLLSTPINDYPAFGAALAFLFVLPPGDVVTLLRKRAQRLELQLAKVNEDHSITTLGLDDEFSTTQLETELAFVKRLRADLESGSLLGLDDRRLLHDGSELQWSALSPTCISRQGRRVR